MCRSRERPLLMWARKGVVEEAMCEDRRRLRQRMSGSSHYVLRAVAPRPRWSLTGGGWGRRHRVRRNDVVRRISPATHGDGISWFWHECCSSFRVSTATLFSPSPHPTPPSAATSSDPCHSPGPLVALPPRSRAASYARRPLQPSQAREAPQPHRPVPAPPVSCDGCSMLPAPAWAPAAAAATAPHGQLRR